MKNSYLYPISDRNNKYKFNPYLCNFMDALKKEFLFLNRRNPSKIGLLDIIKYVMKIDYIFFHWPEDIVERKYGFIQVCLLSLVLPILILRNTNIVYIVHNKISHSKDHYKIKRLIAKTLINCSSRIITHSKDGIVFINSFTNNKKKIFYFPHPVIDERPFPEVKKNIDILIWGSISPYKGIHRFLKLINQSELLLKSKIVIAGKIISNNYRKEISKLCSNNIVLMDRYIDNYELKSLICESRIVLFPYHPESILSSGAFAKSIVYPVSIIGPKCGAFNDFSYLKNISTYKDENEMIEQIISKLLSSKDCIYDIPDNLIEKYSWQRFGEVFISGLKTSNKT